jgi:site-specific recombinase XerD
VGVLDPADQAVEAQAAQVVGHLAGTVGGAEQPGGQGAQALVSQAAGAGQREGQGAGQGHDPGVAEPQGRGPPAILRFCAREEWLPGDLGATIDVPRLPERLPKPLDAGDRDLLLEVLPAETLEELRDRALVLFLLSTGCRISEALRLDVEDWDPRRMRVIGKGDRERTVTLINRARQAVEGYLAARDDPSPALFIGFQPATRGARENRLTADGARHVCREVARRLGIPAFRPHQLRHTLGTMLQEVMGDARLTAETLGHRGLASVSGYTKITDARRREAYEEIQRRGL